MTEDEDATDTAMSTGISDRIRGWDDLLLTEESIDEALEVALEIVQRVLGAAPAVSITVRAAGGSPPQTRAATADHARRLDQWQYVHGEGPCITADAEKDVCVVNDLRDDDTFGAFAEVALDIGVRAVASFPLLVRDRNIGSLNVFFPEAGAIGDDTVRSGRQLALTLSPMLANFLTHQRSVELSDQLQQALEGRSIIERAKGLLMERLGVGADRAFELLSTQSQHENRKVRKIAAGLVARHEEQVAGRPGPAEQ